ncbi:MAG: hypothetical protein V3W22_00665 [Thermoplasmata archaeon]
MKDFMGVGLAVGVVVSTGIGAGIGMIAGGMSFWVRFILILGAGFGFSFGALVTDLVAGKLQSPPSLRFQKPPV